MKPKVTIGICARNSESTIKQAILSVFRQSYPHELIEIIIVDDGSQDNTLAVTKSCFLRNNFNYKIFSGTWQGLGKARNLVVNNASGKYIVWLDSDETIEKDFLVKQINLIDQNSNVGIVTARLGISEGQNMVLTLEIMPLAIETWCQNWQQSWKLPGTGGSTYRVDVARQVGGFNDAITDRGEDIDIALRIRRAGWLILSGKGVFYECHASLSTWSNLLKRSLKQGKQHRLLYEKTPGFFSLYKMNPMASFIASIRYTVKGYCMTRRKILFLLPFHFTIKMTFWFYAFTQK